MSKPAPMLSASDHGSTNASAPPRTSRRSGRPSREEADLLDEQIMEAARLSFTAVGFSATTIERVASQSGTTPRSVMHRFADKDALLYAAVDRRSEEHTSELQSNANLVRRLLLEKKKKTDN